MGAAAFEPAGPVAPVSATSSAPLAGSPAAAAARPPGSTPAAGDSAHSSPVRPSATAPPPMPHRSNVSMSLHRLTALPGAVLRGTAAVPAAVHARATGSGRECLLHVRCSFSAFTREEVEAAGAASAGRPGIVTILRRWGAGKVCGGGTVEGCLPCSRTDLQQGGPLLPPHTHVCTPAHPPHLPPLFLCRLSRQSKVPGLLRSGVLHLHLERAEGLASKAQAGFTKNL